MQLTILLYLLYQRAESVPSDRTGLYREYMAHYLDREAAKDADVQQYRASLEQVTSYLGWHLQAAAETDGNNGRVSLGELKKLMQGYLSENGLDQPLVDRLFTAATTRVWVITSRIQGLFEFDVQPVREYFAAHYLATNAQPGGRGSRPDKFRIFSELVVRAYWQNVARFMAGFFTSGELGTLVDELIAITERPECSVWSRRLIRMLIDDGAFDQRPRALKRATAAAYDALGIRIAIHELRREQLRPLSRDRGGSDLVELLKTQLRGQPASPQSFARARLLERLNGGGWSPGGGDM
jgi:hypothetical protein